jgi:argininosuccinate lyase
MGEAIGNNTYVPVKTAKHTHQGSLGNLCLDRIQEKMNRARKLFTESSEG